VVLGKERGEKGRISLLHEIVRACASRLLRKRGQQHDSDMLFADSSCICH